MLSTMIKGGTTKLNYPNVLLQQSMIIKSKSFHVGIYITIYSIKLLIPQNAVIQTSPNLVLRHAFQCNCRFTELLTLGPGNSAFAIHKLQKFAL